MRRKVFLFLGIAIAVFVAVPFVIFADENGNGRNGNGGDKTRNRIEIRREERNGDGRIEERIENNNDRKRIEIRVEKEDEARFNIFRIFDVNQVNRIIEKNDGTFEVRIRARGTREEIIKVLEDAIELLEEK